MKHLHYYLLVFLLSVVNACESGKIKTLETTYQELIHLIREFDKRNNDTLLVHKIDSLFDQLTLTDQSAETYNLRGGYLVNTARIPEAKHWYLKSLVLDSCNTGAHTMLGILADHEGEQQTAQQHYQIAMNTIDSLLVDIKLSQDNLLLFQHKATLLLLSQGSAAALAFWDTLESSNQQLSSTIAFEKEIMNDLGKEGYISQLVGNN